MGAAIPSSAQASCGNPANGACLADSCEPADALHEVRCCSDDEVDGYQQRNGCAVWAESVFSTVEGDGCVHDADLATAFATCAAEGTRLCTLEEIQGSCTAGTGCGHDADHVWTGDACGDEPEPEPEPEPTGSFMVDCEQRNYWDSVDFCASQGMTIASIHNQEDND